MAICLKTALPGPRSKELLARHEQFVSPAFAVTFPIFVERAEGALLRDVDGNTLIDFTGGVGVLNVGHANPRLVEAVKAQAERFFHTDYTVVPYREFADLAERLIGASPFAGQKARAAFFNSGAEAVENAVKIAKLATGRSGVIAYRGGFHGRTLMALSLTWKVEPYKKGMGPFAEVSRAPYPDPYRGTSEEEALERLRYLLGTHVDPQTVAAVVIEPVLGEGGFVYAGDDYLQGLREICDEHGIMLIADEVQTGFGRTGKMFAIEYSGITPDLICVAKSIAGGLPLSGVLGKAEVMGAVHPGAIGGTYPGNPLALAAGLAVLDEFEEKELVARASEIGDTVRTRMESWASEDPTIGCIRGLGAMLALEFVADPELKTPDPARATAVQAAAFECGLLLLRAGVFGNCLRLLLPLTVEDDVLAEGLDVWASALGVSA